MFGVVGTRSMALVVPALILVLVLVLVVRPQVPRQVLASRVLWELQVHLQA
jgi:hypothetical protein